MIEAELDRVWWALERVVNAIGSRRGAATFIRALGCADTAGSGPSLAQGSTIPGFHISVAQPPLQLVLEGRHRFATYALAFRLNEADPGWTKLVAESRAEFAGPAGRLYGWLLIATGVHVRTVRSMLAAVARRAEVCSSSP